LWSFCRRKHSSEEPPFPPAGGVCNFSGSSSQKNLYTFDRTTWHPFFFPRLIRVFLSFATWNSRESMLRGQFPPSFSGMKMAASLPPFFSLLPRMSGEKVASFLSLFPMHYPRSRQTLSPCLITETQRNVPSGFWLLSPRPLWPTPQLDKSLSNFTRNLKRLLTVPLVGFFFTLTGLSAFFTQIRVLFHKLGGIPFLSRTLHQPPSSPIVSDGCPLFSRSRTRTDRIPLLLPLLP